MKRLKELVGLIFAFSVMLSITAFAEVPTWENSPGNHGPSILLPDDVTSTSDRVERHGRGEIIYQSVFLDQWDEASQEWEEIDYWEFEKEKGSNTSFTRWSKSFTVSGCTVNEYYRARGLHSVELNGESEGCSSKTSGIKLTK